MVTWLRYLSFSMQMQTDSHLGKTERWRDEQVISLTDYKISTIVSHLLSQ